jgi:hypothetical protein
MTRREPKILLWDLETAHVEAKVWSLFKPMINPGDIINDWFILCGAWKFLGEKRVHTAACTKKELLARDDKRIVKQIREAVDKADIIVAHNGDAFDTKKLKARIIKHGLKPLSYVKSIDTLKVARKEFKFTSNRLDAIGDFLGVGRKIANMPGLWDKVEAGSMKHMKLMLDYNKQDVNLLEEVYLKLRPHMSNHPNLNVITGEGHNESCKACTSTNTQKYGIRYAVAKKYQKFLCKNCGHVFSNGKAI